MVGDFFVTGKSTRKLPPSSRQFKVEPVLEYFRQVVAFRSRDTMPFDSACPIVERNSILLPFDTIRQDIMK